jgi:hypothetical protein
MPPPCVLASLAIFPEHPDCDFDNAQVRCEGEMRPGLRQRSEADGALREFAVGIMLDSLLAQPRQSLGCAGGRPFLGAIRGAELRVEAAIPSPRNRAGDVARAEVVEDASRPAVSGPSVRNLARGKWRSACSFS